MNALTLTQTPATYIAFPQAHVNIMRTLQTTQRVALTAAACLTYAAVLVLGTVYALGTTAYAITLHAHEHAGYSPLVVGPAYRAPLALMPAEFETGTEHGPVALLPGVTPVAPVAPVTSRTRPALTGAGHTLVAPEFTTVTPERPVPIASLPVVVLKRAARKMGLAKVSSMRKADLVQLLTERGVLDAASLYAI